MGAYDSCSMPLQGRNHNGCGAGHAAGQQRRLVTEPGVSRQLDETQFGRSTKAQLMAGKLLTKPRLQLTGSTILEWDVVIGDQTKTRGRLDRDVAAEFGLFVPSLDLHW
jgi:hypothetical protein